MAPQGQYTRSRRYFVAFSIFIVTVMLIGFAVFRDELLSGIKALKPISQCVCPGLPTTTLPSLHEGHNDQIKAEEKQKHQPLIPITFADLTILDELAPANVLWVNETGTSDSNPEAWGISMFHALHCVKMWKESLSPGTMMDSHVHSESEYAEHATHCINYLIQVSKKSATSHNSH